MSSQRRSRSQVALALGVVIGIALSSTMALGPGNQSHISGPSAGPGLASVSAFDQVWPKVNQLPGGPWGLVSMVGVIGTANPAPFSTGQDICQVLPGPTLWNLSQAPELSTSLWSGQAVFWQLVFINQSYAMTFGSDVNGSTLIDGPYSSNSPCVSYLETGFGGLFVGSFPRSFWLPGGTFDSTTVQTLLQLNSSSWAPTAADSVGNKSMQSWGGDVVVYYTLGYTWLNLVWWTEGGWLVRYWACGIPGRIGDQPFTETGWALNSTPTEFYGSVAGITSCQVDTNASFVVTFNESSIPVSAGAALGERLTIGLNVTGVIAFYDTANSLVSWMTRVSLDSSSGDPIVPAVEQCGVAASNLSDCAAPASSWYAVLLSPSGYVLDEYPSSIGGNEWSIPNVFVTNNDTLAMLSSSILTGSGDVLSITGVYSFPAVLGNVML